MFNTEWRFMLCFARAGAWKKTLLGVFLLFAGGMVLGNVPQLPDWTKEKVPARVENVLGGSFLSVDPVLTDANTGASFNRYVYALNSPYKYIDPDGRAVETPWDAANVAMGVVSLTKNLAIGNYAGAAVDAVGVLVDSAATVAPGVPGGAATVINAVRVADVASTAAKPLVSRISESAKLVKEAEKSGKSEQVQKGVDKLTDQLSKGNTNPGMGNKPIGNGISEARHSSGARVYFKETNEAIEVLGKSGKDNQQSVIKEVLDVFGK